MAFGSPKQETVKQEAVKQGTGVDPTQLGQTAAEAESYLNEFAGQGTSDIGPEAISTSYLTILQDLSDAVKNHVAGAEPGLFFNTGTQKPYSTEVRVIPVAFKTVWDERDAGGKTVARYEPHTIKVDEEPVPPGKTGFPKMKNPLSGNYIIETFAYALVLADHPEVGFVMMTAGVGSMKAFRRWNTMLKQMLLPNGAPAPIFVKVWTLKTGVKISKTTGKPYYALEGVTEDGWVKKELFQQVVLPARTTATTRLLAPPTVVEEESDEPAM